MKHSRHPLRYLWTAIASLIILLAVMVSLARTLLPYFDSYRATLEAQLSDYLGQPITIERLDVRLLRLTPSIILRHVTLKSASGDSLARFEEIRLGIDLYDSLRKRAPVLSELVVGGAQIAVVRHGDGSFSVEGMSVRPQEQTESGEPAALGYWLLSQGRLAVRDSTLVWRDEQQALTLAFEHVDLELLNSGERHQLNASVALPEGSGKSLRVAADLTGNPLAGMAWDGAVYVKAESLHPLYWLPLVSADIEGLPLKAGEFSTELWSDWESGRLQRSQGNFAWRDVVLQAENQPATSVQAFSGELQWQRQASGWDVDLQHLQLLLKDEVAERSRIHLEHREERDLLMADWLRLDDLLAVVRQLPLPQEQMELATTVAPRGELRQLRVERRADGYITTQGEFTALGINPWQAIPGFDGLSGHWRSDEQGGEITLDSHEAVFDAPRLFRAPLKLDSLATQLSFHREEQGWRVSANNITAANEDIHAEGELLMQLEPERKPYLDLRLSFSDGVARHVPRYVPAHIMGEGVVNWLDGAFSKGQAHRGTVLFHGRTGDFPFRDNQGVFETRFDAEGVELAFAKGWPHLTRISGEVAFLNQGLTISPRSGVLFSTPIKSGAVAVADLKAPRLDISLTAAPPTSDVLRLFRETPLASHVGDALAGMSAKGGSDLELQLQLPLSKAMEEKAPFHYEGSVTLHDAQLQVWEGVTFSALSGQIRFKDNTFQAEKLQGLLYDAPALISLATEKNGRTVVSAEGSFSVEALRREMTWPQLAHLNGASDWRALLYLPRGENTHPSLELHSSLMGVALDVPAPLAKSPEESLPLSVRLAFGQDSAKRLALSLGNRLAGRFAFSGKEMQLERAALHIGGKGGAELPEQPGWLISGSLDSFDWARWRKLLPEGSGEATPPLPVTLRMERLGILSSEGEGTRDDSFTPAKVPVLDLHVRNFSYDSWHLGTLTGSSRSDAGQWNMPDLHFVGPHYTIDLKAQWRAGEQSRLQINATSDHIEQMLTSLGFASMIGRGKGGLSGQLTWPGMLNDFSWARAEGQLSVALSQGALIEVDPGAGGRIFGLLSLQALPRRLSLDFRDLFQTGMQFDEVKGDIHLSRGEAYTNNLFIKSPSAGILVEGSTGLVRRDYNHIISVVPNVSGSLSIASAIAWGPQVAAAVLLAQSIFKKDIAKATVIRYAVTGSWDDPQINRLEQTQTPLPAPKSSATE